MVFCLDDEHVEVSPKNIGNLKHLEVTLSRMEFGHLVADFFVTNNFSLIQLSINVDSCVECSVIFPSLVTSSV